MNVRIPNTEMLSQFQTDGYLAIPRFLVDKDLRQLVQNVDRFIRDVVPTLPSERVFYEEIGDKSTLKQIQHLGNYDSWFHAFFTTGRFREVAEVLLSGPVIPKNLQYFNKPPRIGQGTPPHQDGYYFMLDPCEAVTMWFALDNADEENGCVRYVRGSHKHGMRDHARTQTLGFSQGIVDYPSATDAEVAMHAQPGDLLVHNAMTIHRADANRSVRDRRALGFIYYSERVCEDVAAHSAYQQRLTDELSNAGKI